MENKQKLSISWNPASGEFTVQCDGGMATARGLLIFAADNVRLIAAGNCEQYESKHKDTQELELVCDADGGLTAKSNCDIATRRGLIAMAGQFYQENFGGMLRMAAMQQAQSLLHAPSRPGFRQRA